MNTKVGWLHELKELLMNTRCGRSLIIGLLAAGLVTGSCGCTPPIKRTVNITAADDVCKKSVEVHLVGVTRYEREGWALMPMSEYWEPENERRVNAKEYTHVIRFGQEPCERVFGKKEPMRKVWKGRSAEYLFVLADLPGVFDDLPGNNDARRVEVPALDSKDWGWQSEIEIVIKSSAVEVRTVPKK